MGLKDALATLNRRGIAIRLESRHCDISLTRAPKHGFDDVVTLQATIESASAPSAVGTDIELCGIPDSEIEAAQDFFLCFSGEHVLDETQYGQILERRPSRNSRIYVSGLLVAEEARFAFSYNITSLTAAMRKALNRERTNVGRTAYADRVKAMLLASKSESVAELLAKDLTLIEVGTQHDEVNWTDVAVHACQILNARKKVVFVSAAELSQSRNAVDHAVNDGYNLITVPDNVRRLLAGAHDLQGNPVRDLGVYQQEWNESFEFKFVTQDRLSRSEKAVFDRWKSIVGLVGGLPRNVREIKISETMCPDFSTGQECQGLWEERKNRIIIKRSELRSLDSFAGTLLHELTHAHTGFPDVSRQFESALTDVIGKVSSACLLER